MKPEGFTSKARMTKLRWLFSGLLFAWALPSCSNPTDSNSQPVPAHTKAAEAPSVDVAGTADTRDLLELVVAAHGGHENFKKSRTGKSSFVVTGTPGVPAGTIVYVTEHFDLPARFRRDATTSPTREWMDFSYVLTEDGSWRREFRDWKLSPLPPGVTPKSIPASNLDELITLAASPEAIEVSSIKTLEGKSYFVLRFASDGPSNIALHVDSETHLVCSSHKSVGSVETQDLVETETFYRDYKRIDGIMVPMTIEAFQNGKPWLRTVMKEITFVETLDASVFDLD